MTFSLPRIEPIWPLLVVTTSAAILIGLTYWTYRGVRAADGGRRWWLLGLRLTALAVAYVMIVKPHWEPQELLRHPSVVIIIWDKSKSMRIADEQPGITRWQAALQDWKAAEQDIEKLEKEFNIRIALYEFDGTDSGGRSNLRELRKDQEPAGEQTAILAALDEVPVRGSGNPVLAIVLYSDGRDNSSGRDRTGRPLMKKVTDKLRNAPCPVHAIGLGHPSGSELQPDIIATEIEAGQTARVKERLVVHGELKAQKFANQDIRVWLLIDGQKVKQADDPARDVFVTVRPERVNETIPIEMPACQLPGTPGEVKVSIFAEPLAGELNPGNNEASSYLTLTKEGLSVLLIEGKYRAWEPRFLSRALKQDERITFYQAYLFRDSGADADRERRELLQHLEQSAYDVIILGDVPKSRFDNQLLAHIDKRVTEGAGLVMIGGLQSFGDGGWGEGGNENSVKSLLPVHLNRRGQLEGAAGARKELRFVPTEDGLTADQVRFILRLHGDPAENKKWWDDLPPLEGGSVLGPPKDLATVLARTPDGDVLLAVQNVGKGRTAALAVDTTWRWVQDGPSRNPSRPELSFGSEAHLRFWRQLILWLAHKEKTGNAVQITLDHRRLAAGKEQGITVQAFEPAPEGSLAERRPLTNVQFTVTVKKPKGEERVNVTPAPEGQGKQQGKFTATDDAGEYEVIVEARQNGVAIPEGQASVRFMTYREDSETYESTPNHKLLELLAGQTGGSIRLHSGLSDVLKQLKPHETNQTIKRVKIPNWEEENFGLMLTLFLIFVGCISGEWLLRRLWGLV